MYNETYQVMDASQSAPDTMFSLFTLFIFIAIYLYVAFMMSKIAYRCGCGEFHWWAYIPVLNTLLVIKMANKPIWWLLLLFVPIVNLIAFVVLWMEASKNAGQSSIWGFLAMIPLINFIALFVMAYGGQNNKIPGAHSSGHSSGGQPKPPQPSRPTFPHEPENVR